MAWQEITFSLPKSSVSDYEDTLLSLGAMSLTLRDAADQPLLEPAPDTTPLWDQVLLTAMFEATADPGTVARQLQVALQLERPPVYETNLLQDREWRRTWMDYFRPMQFGRRLWICPSGYERPAQPDAVVIDLDPGLAFGTGSHPTTALCMQWLDANPVTGRSVVDYGCGSGILAIAAARLGAGEVIAVDNDPQALQATASNAEANGVAANIALYAPDNLPAFKADILIANILLEPLLALEHQFAAMLEAGGVIVLAGILAGQQQQIETAYRDDFDFDTLKKLQRQAYLKFFLTRFRFIRMLPKLFSIRSSKKYLKAIERNFMPRFLSGDASRVN